MSLTDLRHQYVATHLPDATWTDLTVAGARCDAIVTGDGPPLVLMHGGLDSSMQWIPILLGLARHFRCYIPERPSNGASEAFGYRNLTSDFRNHASGVVTDMFDGLGVDQASIVGNSMGGLFSLAFATAHPERVKEVVFVGVPAGHEDHALPAPVRLMGHTLTRNLIAWLSARAGPKDAKRIVRQLVMAHPDRYPAQLLELAAANTRRNARAWRDFAARIVDGKTLSQDLRSTDWLKDLTVPASYIIGSRDAFGTPGHIKDLAAEIHAPVSVIPDAGHLPWLDEPELTTKAILDHLGVLTQPSNKS